MHFLTCLMVKILGRIQDDSVMENLLIDTVANFNKRFSTAYSDQDINDVTMQLTKHNTILNMTDSDAMHCWTLT